MKDKIKKVSIVIPTYGGRDTLCRAIDSVLAQSYENIEILVIDDNSPDSDGRKITEKNMQKYSNNDKVKYFRHARNSERSAARNTGIENSTGEYIMFLDDDDEFCQDKVKLQLEYMEKNGPEYSCTYTRYINVDETGKTVMYCAEKRSGYLLEEVLKRNMFVHAGSNLMVRKSVISEVGGFNININACEDVEFLGRLLQHYKIGYVDYQGLIVHIEHSISKNYKKNVEKYIETIGPLLNTLPEKDRQKVIKRIQMQICRYDIGSKDFSGLKGRMKSYNISLHDLIKYGIHLCIRKITKKSCGYNA